MNIKASSPDNYIKQLSPERQEVVSKIRAIVLENMPKGFEECINYDMIGYVVPKSIFPAGYHCDPRLPLPFINLASQKNFVAFYHMGIYAMPDLLEWFVDEYPKHCKTKLDMGKSCIRFKKMDDIPYQLLAELVQKITVEDWITVYKKSFLD